MATSGNYTASINPQETNGLLNIGAWSTVYDLYDGFKSFSITWSGHNKNGNHISGSGVPTVQQWMPSYVEADLQTPLDFSYPGSAKGIFVSTKCTITCYTSWQGRSDHGSSGGSDSGGSSSGSTSTSYKTKFTFTGAVDKTVDVNATNKTISTQITPNLPGEVYCKFEVGGASKTVATEITGSNENKYIGFYFFGDKMGDSLNDSNIKNVVIKLYNVYDRYEYQKSPKGLTYSIYGHSYKSFNECKKLTATPTLKLIKTFEFMGAKDSQYIEIKLSSSEWNTLKSYEGLAFAINTKDSLTVHDVKCIIDIQHTVNK
jgi:hypothetical protein